MLGKLMKYEFRSSGRLFILIYAAILAVAFVMMFVDGEKEQCK